MKFEIWRLEGLPSCNGQWRGRVFKLCGEPVGITNAVQWLWLPLRVDSVLFSSCFSNYPVYPSCFARKIRTRHLLVAIYSWVYAIRHSWLSARSDNTLTASVWRKCNNCAAIATTTTSGETSDGRDDKLIHAKLMRVIISLLSSKILPSYQAYRSPWPSNYHCTKTLQYGHSPLSSLTNNLPNFKLGEPTNLSFSNRWPASRYDSWYISYQRTRLSRYRLLSELVFSVDVLTTLPVLIFHNLLRHPSFHLPVSSQSLTHLIWIQTLYTERRMRNESCDGVDVVFNTESSREVELFNSFRF